MFIKKKRYKELLDRITTLDTERGEYKAESEYYCDRAGEFERRLTELKDFSEKFREFYDKVVEIPTLIVNRDEAVVISGYHKLSEIEINYSDVIDHVKMKMSHDIANQLFKLGLINYDLVSDPVSGGVVYKAYIKVLK